MNTELAHARPRQFHFLGGLPRAGSTLIANILAQNPRIHATHTSGCMDVLFGVRNRWDGQYEHRAHPMPEAKRNVLRAILHAYYQEVDRPVVVDKSRGWVSVIEMIEGILGEKAKILVPVRDVREVLASMELIWRREAATRQAPGEGEHYFQFQTLEGRLAFWMQDNQPAGLAYNRIRDAINRGLRDRLHFVRFEDLTTDPQRAVDAIYRFLEVPAHAHDFENVVQVTRENDAAFGFDDLHTIRERVEPVAERWPEVLGTAAERFAGTDFWNKL